MKYIILSLLGFATIFSLTNKRKCFKLKPKPFGTYLGSTNNVDAYSSYDYYNPKDTNYVNMIVPEKQRFSANLKDSRYFNVPEKQRFSANLKDSRYFNVPEKQRFSANLKQIFTGIKWQCVEYARRYLILNHNITFQEIDNAYDIFALDYFNSIIDNSLIPIRKISNNSNIPFHVGSLLIWSKDFNKYLTGHVAVITEMNISLANHNNYITISEQNFDNVNFKRNLKVTVTNGKIFIHDKNILGWINFL